MTLIVFDTESSDVGDVWYSALGSGMSPTQSEDKVEEWIDDGWHVAVVEIQGWMMPKDDITEVLE